MMILLNHHYMFAQESAQNQKNDNKAVNNPCPETPTVTYEGQVYNTVKIGDQCWLKENLNVGEMIMNTEEMEDNGVIEKYCYDNDADSCAKYGGLYQWDEMMQYSNQPATQGICPPDWHIPTHEDWVILEGEVDNHYDRWDEIWDGTSINRGYDVGYNLKTTDGWNPYAYGADSVGFSGMPAGNRNLLGNFNSIGNYAIWWVSETSVDKEGKDSEKPNNDESALYRSLSHQLHQVIMQTASNKNAFSVRCVRNY